MELDYILSIVNTGAIDKLKSTLEISKLAYFVNDSFANAGLIGSTTTGFTVTGDAFHIRDLEQYNPKRHSVHSRVLRPNKSIKGEDGDIIKSVEVARLSIPEQQRIVLLASSFLGNPELAATPQTDIETDLFDLLNAIQDKNKIDYKFTDIKERTMSERECAELWYTQKADTDYWDGTPLEGCKFKQRVRLLSPVLGDSLYPCYDQYGDMVAFGRYYETVETIPGSLLNTQERTCHFDLYTATNIYLMEKYGINGTNWNYVNPDGTAGTANGTPNTIGKIPVIYYSQPATEWSYVQEMIERLEKKISNHADSNDYYDSPIVVAMGEIEGFAAKGEQGKVLEVKNGGDVKYLESNGAPESMEMEINNLISFIDKYTHSPNISFDSVKGLGTFTGIALKMFFMDAHLKAATKEAIFGDGVQRRVNYLKQAIATMDSKFKPALKLNVCPEFTYFMPKDDQSEVATIVNAYGAGLISLETAVKLNPLVDDYVAELELIKDEAESKPKPPDSIIIPAPPKTLDLSTT